MITILLLAEGIDAIFHGRPIGVMTLDAAEVRPLDLEAADVVHLVGLDESGIGVLHGPDHRCEHGRRHLHSRGVLVGRETPGLVNRQSRAVPHRAPGVPVQEYAEVVVPGHDLLGREDVLPSRQDAGTVRLVERQDAVVARVVGVVTRGTVNDAAGGGAVGGGGGRRPVPAVPLPHGVVVRDRKALVVGDEQPELRPRARHPRPDAGVAARPVHPYPVTRTMGVTMSPPGHALLVRAPPELGGLVPLRQKAVDGPRVDEHARGLRAI